MEYSDYVESRPPAGTLTGAEKLAVSQDGDAVRLTAQDIADLAGGGTIQSVTGFVDDTDPANPIVLDHYCQTFDASGGGLPTNGNGPGGVPMGGDWWVISVAGTIFGISVDVKQRFGAIITDPQDADDIWYS